TVAAVVGELEEKKEEEKRREERRAQRRKERRRLTESSEESVESVEPVAPVVPTKSVETSKGVEKTARDDPEISRSEPEIVEIVPRVKTAPVYDSYADYFAPPELRHSADESDTPRIVLIEPASVRFGREMAKLLSDVPDVDPTHMQ